MDTLPRFASLAQGGMPATSWLAAVLLSVGGLTSPARAEAPFLREVGDTGLPRDGKTYGATWLDVDGDGRLDLFLSRHARRPEVYRHRGGFRFEAVDPGTCELHELRDQHGGAACDYDDDGDWDLYITVGAGAGKSEGANQLWSQQAPCVFSTTSPQDPLADLHGRGRGALWVELNGDDRPELLVLNYRSASRLFRIDRDAVEDLTPLLPLDPRTGRTVACTSALGSDLDGDGDFDLLLGGPPHAFLVQAEGTLRGVLPAESGLALSPRALARPVAGDVDEDGDEDLVIGYRAPPRIEVWLNASRDGQPRYARGPDAGELPLADTIVSLLLADLDNDGHLDLHVSQLAMHPSGIPCKAPDLVARGTGDGRFAAVHVIHPRRATSAPACAWPLDLDRDGDLDLVTFHGGEPPPGGEEDAVLVYENSTPLAGLTLELVAASGPPHGLGSVAEVRSERRRWVRWVRAEANPWNSTILPLHVGVGEDPGPFELEVRWPSGRRDRVLIPRAAAAYRVREGHDEAERLH